MNETLLATKQLSMPKRIPQCISLKFQINLMSLFERFQESQYKAFLLLYTLLKQIGATPTRVAALNLIIVRKDVMRP